MLKKKKKVVFVSSTQRSFANPGYCWLFLAEAWVTVQVVSHRRLETKTPRWLEGQIVELLCTSSCEEELYRTMDSVILYWRTHSLEVFCGVCCCCCYDALCQRTGSHSGAGLPPNVINLATVGHSGICEHRDKARLKDISTEVKSAGSCNMGAALGAGREVPRQDPSVDPKSSDTSFLSYLFCNILSYQSCQQNPNKSYFLTSAITILNWR